VARYADDSVVGFEEVRTARAFLEDLRERLAKFGLTLHPDKTRLIEFVVLRPSGGVNGGRVDRRRLTSWDSRIAAGRTDKESSRSCD